MEWLAQQGLGTLFSGIGGLLQLTLLPGMLVQQWLSRDRLVVPITDSLLFVFASSCVISFSLALLLHVTGLHQRTVWMTLGWAQVVALLLLVRQRQQPQGARAEQLSLPLVSLLSLLVYVFCLAGLLRTIVGHWPGVLEGWDAVVSWNRWARDWTHGDWPYLTWGYPQLVPVLWSVLYVWQQSTEIEFFVRILMGLFPLGLVLVFLAAFVHWRRWSLLLAGAATTGLLLGPYRAVLDTGYVDVPVTFATLLTGHWMMLAQQDVERRSRWLFYAAVATALAMLTKQSGILALGLFVWGCWRCNFPSLVWRRPLLLLMALTVLWYVLTALYESGDSVITYVTGDIYGNETLPQRVERALTQTLPQLLRIGENQTRNSIISILGTAGLLLALRDRDGRFCAVVGFGYVLVWAAFFSYDGRNLLPGIPFVLLAVANGYGWMPLSKQWTEESLQTRSLGDGVFLQRVLPVLSLLVLVASLLPANAALWELRTNERRKLTGDADFNTRLLEIAMDAEAAGSVYTTYPPMVAIRELRPFWFNDYGASHMQPQTAAALQNGALLCDLLPTIARHNEIRYVLLHDSIFPAVIGPALANGSLQTLVAGNGVRLMRLHCPQSGASQ